MKKLFYNISKLYGANDRGTFKSGAEMQQLNVVENAWILVENGKIAAIGNIDAEMPSEVIERIDLLGAEVLPGFVDSHTHIVFAAPRHEEFAMRLAGASYEEIAANGGGILNSARKLQAMSEDELYDQAAERLKLMFAHGTTTVEIKSGYGLTVDAELKILRVIKRLKQNFTCLIKSTFLGAHAFPVEYKNNQQGYIDLILNEMLPVIVHEQLADHIDVFCDKGFFTVEQTAEILTAASKYGIPAKIHANELGLTGGVQIAVEHEAWSADHLEHCEENEIAALKKGFTQNYGGTMPVGLPGTSYFLGIPYTPTKRFMENGLPVALATDFNPGSSPLCSLQTIWALACTQMKMMPVEAFHAITCNAARALRLENEVGSLAVGMRADFVVTKTKEAIKGIPYFVGQNHIEATFVLGARI
jgi:imidazolonepropionase